MMAEWNLEWVWIIFIQGPLLLLRGLQEIFSGLIGNNISDVFIGKNSVGASILIIYGIMVLISIIFTVYSIITRIVKSRSNELDMKQSVINIVKYSLINIAILVLLPLLIIFATFIFNIIFNSIFNSLNMVYSFKDFVISDKLYWIGYLGNGTPSINIGQYGPPNMIVNGNSFLKEFNYVVEIISILISLFLPFYISWTFIQKYVEIFIFTTVIPLAITTNFIDDGSRFRMLMKQVFSKFIIILWCIIAYWMYIVIYYILFNELDKGSISTITKNNKGTIFLVASLAINLAIFGIGKIISKSLNQNIGIIGSFKSSKNTYNFTRKMFDKNSDIYKVREMYNSIDEIKEMEKENKKSINSLKSSIEISNKNNSSFNKVRDVDIFKDKENEV